MIITCRHCRNDFEQTNPIQKFCPICAEIRKKHSVKESHKKHRTTEPNRSVIT